MAKQEITSSRKPYYTQMDSMLMVELSIYQYMLLSHYYRICSLPSQQTTLSDEKLAKLCGFSVRKLSTTRKELAKMGYITVVNRNKENGGTLLVTVNDVQDTNLDYWQNRNFVTAEIQDPSAHDADPSAHDADSGLHTMPTNKNKDNKNKKENSLSSADDEHEADSINESDDTPDEPEVIDTDESDTPTNEPLTLPADKSQALTDIEIRTWAIMNVWDIAKPTMRNLNAKSREKRLEIWSKAVRKIHKDNGTQCAESHLNAFKSWWNEKYKGGASLPRKKDSIEDHYEAFYLEKKNGAYHAQQQQAQTQEVDDKKSMAFRSEVMT